MTGVLYHKPDIILLGKYYPSRHIIRFCCVDCIHRRITQFAQWIRSYRGIDRGTGINKRIGVANRRKLLKWRLCPFFAYFLAELGVVARAGIAWFGDGLVVDELSVYRGIKSVPF